MPNPTYEQLIAYAAGQLATGEAAAVAAFVQTDKHAAGVVNAWRAVQGLLAGDDSVEPSVAALARAKAIFAGRAVPSSIAATAAGWIASVDRFVARLVYDSRLQPASVRFADNNDRITLTFETDDGEVDLQASRIDSDRPSWRIMGQIAGAQPARREVAIVLRGSNSPTAIMTSSEHGEFAFDIAPGSYDLLVRRGKTTNLLSPIELLT